MSPQGSGAPNGGARLLIVNADDFGAGEGVNRGVAHAHEHGIVTSASLMVGMSGTLQAVDLARDRPALSLGLHVDLTGEGTPASADLADVEACHAAIRSQLGRFEELVGRAPSHLDAHHNVFRLAHLEPLFVEVAAERSLPLREHSAVRYLPHFYGQWDDGETHLEWIGPDNLIAILADGAPPGITELSCHPGFVDATLRSSYHIEREAELRTLCDPKVRRYVDAELELVNYDDVRELHVGRA